MAQPAKHYQSNTGYQNSMIYGTVIRVDEAYLVYNSEVYYEIGYFTVIGGEEVTLGSNFLQGGNLPPFAAYPNYYYVDANIPFDNEGLTVTFKLYNHSTQKEYYSPNTVITDNDGDSGDIVNPNTLDFYSPATKDIVGYVNDDYKGGYYFIASPIGQVNINKVTGLTANQYDLYRFNQSAEKEWENYEAEDESHNPLHTDFTTLEPGKGYLYANKENVTLVFPGAPYSGNGTVNLVYDAAQSVRFKGWNLIGNPYSTDASLDKPYYRMKADGSGLKTETESSAVEAMEGVFVQATATGQTATFSVSKRDNGPKVIAQANIMVSNNRGSVIDNAIIRFDGGNTLEKYSFREGSTKVYIPSESKDYAVVNANENGEMPIHFKAEANGNYTISFSAENVVFDYLHLIDNLTGNDVDLLATPSYSFNARTDDYASRFKLVFATGNSNDGDSFGFMCDGNLVISGIEGNATMQLVDITGRILNTENFNGSYNKPVNASAGVYTIRLIQGENVRTQKIVVR